jgi:hypothetical protein
MIKWIDASVQMSPVIHTLNNEPVRGGPKNTIAATGNRLRA